MSDYIERCLADSFQTDSELIRFECQQCGECCRSWELPILLTGPDMFRIARYLDISLEQLIKRCCEIHLGGVSKLPVLSLKKTPNGSCIYLQENRCQIHDAKPGVCAIYPLGRSIVEDGDAFTYFRQPVHCDGAATGKAQTLHDWLAQYGMPEWEPAYLAWYDLLAKAARFLMDCPLRDGAYEDFLGTCVTRLYDGYDAKKDYMPQLVENGTALKQEMEALKAKSKNGGNA